MTDQLTLETFSEVNRSKVIGNSLYRIVITPSGKWRVFEIFSDNYRYAHAYSDEVFGDLVDCIDYFNSINREREFTGRYERGEQE